MEPSARRPDSGCSRGCRSRSRASRRCCARRSSPDCVASALRNVAAGNDDIALFEHAHVYLPGGRAASRRARGISAASRRAASRSRRARSRVSTPRSASSRRSELRTISRPRARGARTGEAGSSRCATPTAGRVGRVRARRRSARCARAGADRLRRRHHLPARSPGSRLRRPGRGHGRELVDAAREAAGRSCGRCAPSTSTAATGRARQEVDRLLRDLPVARADAHGRGCRGAPEPHRRGPGRAVRGRAPYLDRGNVTA